MKSDAEIQRDVELELRRRPHIDEADVSIQVHDGIVRLTGFACSYFEKYQTENAAKRVPGVAGVVNDIEVRLTSAASSLWGGGRRQRHLRGGAGG